jgi:hypothetical protein
MVLRSPFPAKLILRLRVLRGDEEPAGKCPSPDSDPFNKVES